MTKLKACRCLGLLALGFIAVVTARPIHAQPYLVKDIDDRGNKTDAGSAPTILGTASGFVIFTANDGVHGREPWATDGNAEGTRLLTDLAPGPESSNVRSLGTVGQRLFFAARVGVFYFFDYVWSTDGTPSGTKQIRFDTLSQDSPHASNDRTVSVLGRVPGPPRLFFSIHNSARYVDELWVSDGTLEGTRFLMDREFEFVESAATVGGQLLFTSRFGGLWKSDGTRGGTVQLRDFELINVGIVALDEGRALFMADDGISGVEPWVSDGTPEGTHLLADLQPGNGSSQTSRPYSDGSSGQAFFVVDAGIGDRQLFRTDGTTSGTFALIQGLEIDEFSIPTTGDGLFFIAARDDAHGRELLVSNGTPGGTHLLDLCPGFCSSLPSEVTATSVGLLFNAEDTEHGREPWTTDGTISGTHLLAELCSGPCGEFTEVFADLGGEVVLRRYLDFWVSDGTTGGTRSLSVPAEMSMPGHSSAVVDGKAIFAAYDLAHGTEPWRMDGTEEGTALVLDVASAPGGSDPAAFAQLDGKLYFAATTGPKRSLWQSDGTEAGTEVVADLTPAEPSLVVHSPVRVGHDLFFVVDRPSSGRTELWRSDGTSGGTVPLFDFVSPAQEPTALAAVGNQVYLLGSGLWKSGRSPGSAQRIADLSFANLFRGSPYGVLNGRLFFAAAAAGHFDFELWETDGTPGETRRVRDISPGSGSSWPGDFTPFAGLLYFLAQHSERAGLWRTDGTEVGTELIFEHRYDLDPPRIVGEVGGRLVFFDGAALWATTGEDLVRLKDPNAGLGSIESAGVRLLDRLYFIDVLGLDSGNEVGRLWSTDGTPQGTGLAELLPREHTLLNLWPAGDELVLLVENPRSEQELWAIDGSPAGSHRIASLAGLEVSLPGPDAPFAVLDGRALFAADSPDVGLELWGAALGARQPPFGPPAPPSDLRAEALSETGVRLTWRESSSDVREFVISGSTAETALGGSVTVPAGTTTVIVQGLPPETPFTFTVAAVNTLGTSAPSNDASATPLPEEAGPCVADAGTLCLLGGRFAVSVLWRDQHNGGIGTGGALPLPGSDRTGLFWFFNQANVELIVKELDGRPVTGSFWSFYGALSDVEYWVTVVDTTSHRNRTYHNRPGAICGVGDTGAFPESAALRASACAAASEPTRTAGVPVVTWPAPVVEKIGLRTLSLPATRGGSEGHLESPIPVAEGSCTSDPETLCLLGGRLRVEVAWHDQHNGGSGTGKAIAGTDKSGFFWFFRSDNVELVVKALDGTAVNGHLWVFYGALSDVEYTLTVTDTTTGATAAYHNPPGDICGGADTAAF